MNSHSHTETFRLHIDHLRTLIERLSSDHGTVEYDLIRYAHPTYAVTLSYANGLRELSEHIAAEIDRLQELLRALQARTRDATAAALGS
jgi:hypothetical protein